MATPAELLRRLVVSGGSGTPDDVAAVRAEAARMSGAILSFLERERVRIVACRGSVTDFAPSLRGKRPRGWPEGATWDAVPGTYFHRRKAVVVATVAGASGARVVPPAGQGHGSFNLTVHEAMHGHDIASGRRLTATRGFKDARKADSPNLPPYLLQKGKAGIEETFAESAARFYGGDGALAGQWPALHAWWQADPAASLRLALSAARPPAAAPARLGAIGEASFEEDGAILLDLRAEEPGVALGHALLRFEPGTEPFARIERHLARGRGAAAARLARASGRQQPLLVRPFP
jgi:hypothetical protein